MAEPSQYNMVNEFVSITMPEKLQTALRDDKQPSRSDSLGRPMQKVPALLRLENNNHKDYDPLVVSFGPYHHGRQELQQAEDFKLKALQLFVADTGNDVVFYYTKVLDLVSYAKSCYIEDSTRIFDDAKFAQMMLLDACFIIHFIVLPESDKHYEIANRYLGDFVSSLVLRDIFLLENQIPFEVLKLVICLGYGADRGEKYLNDFLNETVFGDLSRKKKKKEIVYSEKEQRPFHLLDAFWLTLVTEFRMNVNPILNPAPKPSFGWLKHIGNALGKYCCPPGKGIDDNIHSFRSVTALKARGIHFRPSCADYLMDFSFKPGYIFAQLQVPIWFVSMYTKVFFLNMIAYELCPSARTNGQVTAYIEFMKSLIDIPEDVKELREKKILLTALGSDDEVAKVYKEIRTYELENQFIFPQVKKEIQAHYNHRAKTWVAEFLYTHLKSPWSAIALLAATFLIVLTSLQTYYTVMPSSN